MMSDSVPRENLWMDSEAPGDASFVHRLNPGTRDFIPSPKRCQRIEAEGVRKLFTKRAVSY
jgi:hypothetical protein